MEEIEAKQEETVWDEPLQKSQLHRQRMRRKRCALMALMIVVGLLIVGGVGLGFYMANHSTRPLTLPETVQIQSMTVADLLPLQASDFVQGLEGTDIQVSFGEDYSAQQLGQQEISLVFTRGNEICTMTAQLYRFHIESAVTVALEQASKLSIRAFVPDETVTASFETALPAGKGGIFTLMLRCAEREYAVQCTVTENVPPQGVGKEVTVEAGTMPDPAQFVENIVDHSEVAVTYKDTTDFVLAGKRSLILVLTDLFGNTAEVEAVANVVPAANGPQFTGLETIYLELGATVSYRNGVTATDAQDGTLSFEVDTNGFSSQTAGRYIVYYSATDSDGNQLIAPRIIVVESHIGQIVREKAQAVLDEIIKPGMTQDEKTYAVFRRVKNYVWYSGNSDKSSIENAAYEGFTKWAGDCYTYYAMVRVMLDMLEIPNLEVARVGGTSNHWWNLVQFEDGKYYHIDATPHRITNMEHFKMTESVIAEYTNRPEIMSYRPYYYNYDHTLPEYQNIEIAQ